MVGIALLSLVLVFLVHHHHLKTVKELGCCINELKQEIDELNEYIETYEEWDDHVFQEWLEQKVKNNGGRF